MRGDPPATFDTRRSAGRRREGGRGIHYIAGETSGRSVILQRAARARARHPTAPAGRGRAVRAAHAIVLVDGLAPFVDTFWACALGGVVAVPLRAGRRRRAQGQSSSACSRLPSPVLATERKVFDRLRAYAGERAVVDPEARAAHGVPGRDPRVSISAATGARPTTSRSSRFSSGSTGEPGRDPDASQPHHQHRGHRRKACGTRRATQACRGCTAHARHRTDRLPPSRPVRGRGPLAHAHVALRAAPGPVDRQGGGAPRSP